jgi:hypothetical protein
VVQDRRRTASIPGGAEPRAIEIPLGKRQVKAPKIYLRDSGLLHDLLGIGDPPALSRHPKCGASWERFALDQVLCIALDDLALDALYVVFTGDRRYGPCRHLEHPVHCAQRHRERERRAGLAIGQFNLGTAVDPAQECGF